MPKRIEITCTEADKELILLIFNDDCPFAHKMKTCSENSRCNECMEDNIEFNIVE